MGHLDRPIPIGYVETVASGRNQIADRDLSLYYEALHEVISAPLRDAHRINTLVGFVTGRYDHYLHS